MRDSDEEQIRIDLAATFRIIAHLGMHEAVANHFSAALSADGKTFLLNPKWKHFSRIRASDLLVLNADDERCAARPDVDATAWAIHGQIHQRLPDVRVVLHLHLRYTTSPLVRRRRRSCPSTRTRPAILTGSPSIPCTAGWRTPRQKAPGWRGCWQINAVC